MESNDGNIAGAIAPGECSVMMKVVEEDPGSKEDGGGEKTDAGCCCQMFCICTKRLKRLPRQILTSCSKCFAGALSLGVRGIKTTLVWFLYCLLMVLCFLADISR